MGVSEIAANAKIRYYDGSGEDVTPLPLYIPTEPQRDEEILLDDKDGKPARKSRVSILSTFLNV